MLGQLELLDFNLALGFLLLRQEGIVEAFVGLRFGRG